MGGKNVCVAEYWIMSIYFPVGIALFQANSMQLLNVFGVQEKLLLTAQQPHRPHFIDPAESSSQYLTRWRQLNIVQRTGLGIVVGIFVQLLLSLSIFLASRKFHTFGTFSEHVSAEECRRGPEWIPSILWQLLWSWVFAPYILWKIRKIHDIHHWGLQITCCLIAGLPGSPMWLAALYSTTNVWAAINRYWVPSLWFAPGIMTMEAVTIFFPCYELIVSKRQRDRFLEKLQAWNEKKATSGEKLNSLSSRTPSEASRVPEVYSRGALEKCLEEDSGALLQFAAAKEFSGENVIFLNYVRDWKAAWANIGESEPEYDWNCDPEYHRLHFFKIAVEIYAAYIDMNLAEYPINIESQIYSDLRELFGEASHIIGQSVLSIAGTRANGNLPESYNGMPTYRKKLSTVVTVEEDTHALCSDAHFHEGQSIMHVESRVPNSVIIPANFTADAFEQAEKSIKNLKEAAEIFKLLNENENCDGNQWIVVLGLSQRAIEILDGERRDILGGTSFRFQLEGSTGLVKIVPSSTHPMIINECLTLIDEKLDSMGIPWAGWGWTERATYMLEGNDTKGKQPDQAFIPPSRRVARMGLSERWPTLVIETGVSKSLPRLRLNARDWFASSNGEVRIVLLVGITNSEILFEKWQLAPISEPRPLTQESIDTLRQQDPKMPPLIGQPASGQQAYCAQEVYLKLNEVVGNPLVLPFHAVCDRAPREGESNIVIERSDFEQITKWIFE
ncbi:Regulator of G protein signaling superfamily [Penicillium expansum]|uniref:Regulator of G protein signaling superfamily n=1 Tax=Penicillium expansum TaxID=27334 RepID=A0A0A2IAI0_PENEN|nr:Regulator of G protein signaling superfamily [Penicillium expansum]KGO40059.1 Regulator of G protein signaling superfamily [Penicillium expansum]KGO53177.1 Regulator of G protein signaling superfamily [Penicillium expansum]KGO59289.1 Regulator of G protein signaling superfamily [Penicillium expansum]